MKTLILELVALLSSALRADKSNGDQVVSLQHANIDLQSRLNATLAEAGANVLSEDESAKVNAVIAQATAALPAGPTQVAAVSPMVAAPTVVPVGVPVVASESSVLSLNESAALLPVVE